LAVGTALRSILVFAGAIADSTSGFVRGSWLKLIADS
jgi:hypothetical protein